MADCGWKICRMVVFTVVFGVFTACTAAAQQISIGRIEAMPNMPAPYQMRDWKKTARVYDSLVFLSDRAGEHLPLHSIVTGTVNYPNHESFGMPTYVGTTRPRQFEAVNQIPAVISGALLGIDKRSQAGRNWVLMCEEFFNRRASENVYLNSSASQSGSDWWYSVMPNVYFYQLASMYPGTGEFSYQFRTVADRWLAAVAAMGGGTTPWHRPSMGYRGWYLATMTPNTSGVPEPESAGSIAWILYQAFVATGDVRYRIGAEWAMEYLNSLASNPSYELQLAYGAYAAARMNAELATSYDMTKIVQWCFDVGPLRTWGAVVGRWGGYDVSGLIGEVNGTNDYAFAMNTFQQVGALVPLVRYDDRYARAIGKWVLNAANASRLFYHTGLPEQNQDAHAWAAQYDSAGGIAYEALRQSAGGTSPFATGDAVAGGWSKTNLSLYSSSSAGILGAVVETTTVEKILKLDLLATDYYHARAYPTYLVYNPYAVEKKILFAVGAGSHDVYDAAAKSFAAMNASGTIEVSIPADKACVFVIVPSNGVLRYEGRKTVYNDVVIDHRFIREGVNDPPRIKVCAADTNVVAKQQSIHLYCAAEDLNRDALQYEWKTSGGKLLGEGGLMLWNAPDSIGTFSAACTVSDGKGGADTASVTITVVEQIEPDPVILGIDAEPRKIPIGGTAALRCEAVIATGSGLTYTWSTAKGTLEGGGRTVNWIAPIVEGDYTVTCTVVNKSGGKAVDSVTVLVRDFAAAQAGSLIGYYPLDGTGTDASGNGNNGIVTGTLPVPDRFGTSAGAMLFDGISDAVTAANSPLLNFQNAITVNFWMNIGTLFEREAYPISHGNWENRWKVSLSNGKVRWTVKTSAGVKDVDSKTIPRPGSWYNVTGLYDGRDMELYINGTLEAFTPLSGKISLSPAALTIGQVLPDNARYNYSGMLDDVRIYDYPLLPAAITALAVPGTTSVRTAAGNAPTVYMLKQNYPNPFNGETSITIALPKAEDVNLTIYNILGGIVAELVNGRLEAGEHTVRWASALNASGIYFYRVRAGSFVETRPMQLCK